MLPQESWSASEAESIAAILDGLRLGRTTTRVAGQNGRRLRVVE
ncbi:hypothetical protein [Mycobacteroides abscessus]|nr:hypothetical protein [Mycobacteroides abscessus]